MCACVEPAGTAIGAVCVESGGRKWMLNHTHINCTEECFAFIFGTQRMLVRPVMKRLFFLGKPRKNGSLRSRASLLYDTFHRPRIDNGVYSKHDIITLHD